MEQKEKPLTRAQELRKNATKEENHLWYDFLRTYPVQFLRQKPFGPYIVDFYCHKAKLAIELDGSQHYEGNGPEQDKIRTAYLQEVEKIRVLRFTNLEIKQNFEGVCAAIDRQVRAALPSSGPAGHLPNLSEHSKTRMPAPKHPGLPLKKRIKMKRTVSCEVYDTKKLLTNPTLNVT